MNNIPKKYILKNVSQYDINISDLGVRITINTSIDLLIEKYNLEWSRIIKSRLSGSIFLRLKKGMILEEFFYEDVLDEDIFNEEKETNEVCKEIILEQPQQTPIICEEICSKDINKNTEVFFKNLNEKDLLSVWFDEPKYKKYNITDYLTIYNENTDAKKVLVLHCSTEKYLVGYINQFGLLEAFANCGFKVFGFNFNTFFTKFKNKSFNDVFMFLVEKLKPDWIHLQASTYSWIFDLNVIDKIVKKNPNTYISSWGPDIRYVINKFYVNLGKLIDKPLICSEGQLDDFRKHGCSRIDYWQVGVDPKYFYRKTEDERKLLREKYNHDLVSCLTGGTNPELHEKANRTQLLQKLYLKYPEKTHLYGTLWESLNKKFKRLDFYEQNDVYNGSKIVISMNCVNHVRKYFSNRQLISMACGSLVLTKYIPGLEEYFENHKHLVWFNTEEEFFNLIDYYLEHEDEREKIGENGAKIILEKHTYFQRVNELAYRCGFFSQEYFIENSKKR